MHTLLSISVVDKKRRKKIILILRTLGMSQFFHRMSLHVSHSLEFPLVAQADRDTSSRGSTN